jgi:hypothetical protein
MDGIPDQLLGITSASSDSGATLTPVPTMTGTRTYAGIDTTMTRTEAKEITSLTDANEFILDKDPVATGYADVAIPSNLQECLDFYETGLAAIDAVTDSGLKANGFTQWDLALAEFEADLDFSPLNTLGNRLASIAIAKYRILVRQAMAYAGIPQLGKANASTVESGDGCWRDLGDAYYWTVIGSANGEYAPAFTNKPYYSARRASAKDLYYATFEFAFQINIKCPNLLKDGDQIILSIGDAGWPATYQVGDQLSLPIIGAAPLYLAGGQNASLVQNWYVTGSVSGPLPPLLYDPDAPAAYSGGSPPVLEFTLTPGGIPFAKGDKFSFSVEGGHYRWRKDAASPWTESSPPRSRPAPFRSMRA